MNRNMLTRVAVITAIVAAVSLLIAGVVGVSSGAFRDMAAGKFYRVEDDRVGGANVSERRSVPVNGIRSITVNTVSDDIIVHEASGDRITAWLHGSSASAESRLRVEQRGDRAEIRVERPRPRAGWLGCSWSRGIVLEVGIPKRYAGRLAAEGVSADIELSGQNARELTLKTTSGDIRSEGGLGVTGSLDARSTSGDMEIALATLPKKVSVEAVSGDIRLRTPSGKGFTLDAGSISGDVACDPPVTISSSHAGGRGHSLVGTVGRSEGNITARTTSGDIQISGN